MAIFLTGSTGYLGSYLAAGLFTGYRDSLNLLVRAKSEQEARERLWQSLQLHFEFSEFCDYISTRVRIFRGDLTSERFGLSENEYLTLVNTTDSLIHCAASLNRKSEKQCLNVNLRGSLEVIQLARRAQNRNGLRRYSHVSTVAVAGTRQSEVVREDESIDWARSDYDPYARTKKFCEHMVHQLLPDVPRTIFRPAIVLGDSRKPETTQFDMVQAFSVLASLPVLPLRPDDRIDIVPADYVGKAIVAIHQKESAAHNTYHLSSGTGSQTYRELTDALAKDGGWRKPMYVSSLGSPFSGTVNWLARKKSNLGRGASLLKVFWPYLTWNTVFDNSRVVAELGGEAPAKFSSYAYPLLRFSRANRFRYPAKPWPTEGSAARSASGSSVA
ncbi:MAG TPA: SDR family oxidoreductase [Candidatus Dormibacteraeota bacterium]|jgi:thioester reductase-like protein|nr:SDR family oxidoreductase [Candidatus Dormibacteraeota bacterium]